LLNPLVIAEVLSPSTEARDRGEKFLQYQTIQSLQEYLLISQWPRRFESFLKQENGIWAYRAFPEKPASLEIKSVSCTIAAEDIYNKVRAENACPPRPTPRTPKRSGAPETGESPSPRTFQFQRGSEVLLRNG
jgi:hypothetical protein